MKNETIRSILAGLAEEAAPSAEIDLWKTMGDHLTTSESNFTLGDASMKQNTVQKFTLGRVALVALAVFAVLALALATPQGRAFAESLLQFFTRAQSDTLPPQPTESYTEPARDKSLVEAEELAGFSILTPSTLPEGLSFYGASYDDGLKATIQQFGYAPEDIRLSIKQQPFTSPEACTLCGLVGASAPVEAVQIGSANGEYLEGVWELTDNGPVWQNDPYLKTLRWQKDGMAFELIYMGTELEKDALIAVAESMQ